jgi:hypothetical protein
MSDTAESNEEQMQNDTKKEEEIQEDIYQKSNNEIFSNLEINQSNQQNKNSDLENQKSNQIHENLYIDLEMNKTENTDLESIKHADNTNKINIISNNEDTEIESLKIDEFLSKENIKSNKEYNYNDDTDIRSCRLTERNNNDQYLLIKEDKNNNNNQIKNDNFDDEEQKEEEDLFPFRIVGDAKKKSEHLGKYNNRYLELDSIKGLLKRYMSSKEYPKNPREIIDIRNFKTIKKVKK